MILRIFRQSLLKSGMNARLMKMSDEVLNGKISCE